MRKILHVLFLLAMLSAAFGIPEARAQLSGTDVQMRFRETDQTLPAGLWRLRLNGDTFTLERNTAVAGDFSSLTTPLSMTSTGALTLTSAGGMTITQGTITTNTQGIAGTATWNSSGVAFTLNKFNVTDTASAAGSLLFDYQVGGTSKYTVDKTGTVLTGIWNGTTVGLTYGGTNGSLTASNGGIVYSTASALAILNGTATAGQILRAGSSAAPTWSTATYPATAGTNGNCLKSDGTNFNSSTCVSGSGIVTATSGVLGVTAQVAATSGGTGLDTSASSGIPSISAGTWSINSFSTQRVLYSGASSVLTSANLKFDGSSLGIDAAVDSNSQLNISGTSQGFYGLQVNSTINNGPSAATAYGIYVLPNLYAATSGTPVVAGIRVAPTVTYNGVAIQDVYGIVVNSIASSGATTASALSLRAPTAATNNYIARFMDNLGATAYESFKSNGTLFFSSSVGTGTGGNYLCIDTTTYEVLRGNGAACTASARRFKYDDRQIPYGLDDILKLDPVMYKYRPETHMGDGDKLGFFADDVAKVIPEVVTYKDGQVFGLDYTALVPVLTKAIQEQDARIKVLERRLADLERRPW